MAEHIRDKCIYCKGDMEYTGLEPYVKCKLCGGTFAVTKFQSEQAKLKKALEEGEAAKTALAEAEAQKQAAQERLNAAVEALESIDASQKGARNRLDRLFEQAQADQQTRKAIKELLKGLQSDQAQGQDTLTRLMRMLSDSQAEADGKLTLLQEVAGKLLDAHDDVMARLQAQMDIVRMLQGMKADAETRDALVREFYGWSQSIREEDIARLQGIQTSTAALLSGQQAISERVEALRSQQRKTQQIVEDFRGEYRQDKLKKLEKLYHEAENFQRDRAFDRAAESYRKMLVNGSTDIEVYWRLVLCHYCVEYQRNDEGRLVPSILNPDLSDPEEISERRDLMDNLRDGQEFYLSELKRIDLILDRYRQVRHEMQFDVFISVKQSDNGHPTNDSLTGLKLYDYLTAGGLRVFNSERKELLPAGKEYEPYIIAALMSAKVMIVVGTRPEYMDAQWVRNEWSRFQWLQRQDDQQKGRTERLLLCYVAGGMTPGQIPKALNPSLQAIVDGMDAHLQLDKALAFLHKKADTPPLTPPRSSVKLEAVLRQMTAWLYTGQFDKVTQRYNELIDQSLYLEEARLHLRALCAQAQLTEIEQLSGLENLEKRPLFMLAQRMCRSDADVRLMEKLLAGVTRRPEAPELSETDYIDQLKGALNRGDFDWVLRMYATYSDQPPYRDSTRFHLCAICAERRIRALDLDALARNKANISENPRFMAALRVCTSNEMIGRLYGVIRDNESYRAYGSKKAAPPTPEECLAQMKQALSSGAYNEAEKLYDAYHDKAPYRESSMLHLYGLCAQRQVGEIDRLSQSAKKLMDEPRFRAARLVRRTDADINMLNALLRANSEYIEAQLKAARNGGQAGSGTAEEASKLEECLAQMKQALSSGAYNEAEKLYDAYHDKAPYRESSMLHLYGLCAQRQVGEIDRLSQSAKKLMDEPRFRAARLVRRTDADINMLNALLRANSEYIEAQQKTARNGGQAGSGTAADPSSLYELGLDYEFGRNGRKLDYAEAMKCYRAAALQGHADSEFTIGHLYADGQGVTQDYAEAIKWYRRAADKGQPDAMNNLGVMYGKGLGVRLDYTEALKWYRRAAKSGHILANCNIAYYYYNGKGVQQDYAEALKWYRNAADRGNADAMNNIGVLYGTGLGVPQDYAEALKWYRKAADKGQLDAQKNIGTYYENGYGVNQDFDEAEKWYRMAADKGNENARNCLNALIQRRKAEQQAEAERRAKAQEEAERKAREQEARIQRKAEELAQKEREQKRREAELLKKQKDLEAEQRRKQQPRLPGSEQLSAFWRQNLPSVHNKVIVGTQLTPKLQKHTLKNLNAQLTSDEQMLGLISVKMGFGQGLVTLVVTTRRLYLNIGEPMYPTISADYLEIASASTRPMNTNPKKRVFSIALKNGNTLNVANPSNSLKDTLNFEALANTVNALVKLING